MPDADLLRARLADAEEAYHQLNIGRREVTVEYGMGDGSRKVTYSAADTDKLLGYIKDLKAELGLSRRRAIGLRFS